MDSFFPRYLSARIREAMQDTPVIFLAGPRQVGKTTLARQLSNDSWRYLTLDDELTLLSARQDPVSFVEGLDRAVIDEVQRAPQLLLALKKSVDEDRRPGRFLLTGSANLMALPNVADSLAGRMETLTLLPLSQSEIESNPCNWIDEVFANRIPTGLPDTKDETLVQRVLQGGYPEAIARTTPRRRTTWARQYMDALIQRDVRDVASIDKISLLPRFLKAMALTSGQICNYAKLGGEVGLDSKTAARYVSIFEQMYFFKRIEPWAGNQLSRVVKSPKLHFLDSGLLSILLDLGAEKVVKQKQQFGHVLETFVFAELSKHCSWADDHYQIMYYRDADQVEVDLVIENAAGDMVGIEVKAARSVQLSDLKGLKKLRSLAANRFKAGIVLYDGRQTLPLGDGIWAVPVATLWDAAKQ